MNERSKTVNDKTDIAIAALKACPAQCAQLNGLVAQQESVVGSSAPRSDTRGDIVELGGRSSGSTPDALKQCCELVELGEKIAELSLKVRRVELALELLKFRDQRLLKLRYFDGYAWSCIAERLNYSEGKHAQRRHPVALEAFAKEYNTLPLGANL
jgi:hypothetical protein